MNFRVVMFGAFVLVLVVGGGVAWKAWDEVSGLIASSEADQELCSALDDAEREGLLGVATPTRLTNVEGSLDPYTCRWATEDYETVAAFVQVTSVPADTWAEEIQATLTTNPMAQDALSPQLLKAANSPLRTKADGCRFARVLFRSGGAPSGSERVVAPSTLGTGKPAMVAHSCVRGTYSAVLVTAPDLKFDRSLARKTAQALRTVEKRLN